MIPGLRRSRTWTMGEVLLWLWVSAPFWVTFALALTGALWKRGFSQ